MPKPQNKDAVPNEFVFLPLGGSGEIGMNLNLYGYNGKWLIVDFGVSFSSELGIEVVLPDPEFIVERKNDLAGILLTHAHEDHIGALPYLWKYLKAPLYATPFTAHLIRKKLEDVGLLKEAKIIEIPLSGAVDIGPFKVRLITLTHSIPEPNGVVIETPLGRVMHTGDWKLDPNPGIGEVTDDKALREIGDQGVLAMVCDSTNVYEPGSAGSEFDVREGLLKALDGHKGALIVTCFASNVARIDSVLNAARKLGRKVCLMGRSMLRMVEAAQKCGYLLDYPTLGQYEKGDKFFVSPKEAAALRRDQVLIITTGSQGESRAALSRLAWQQNSDFKLQEGDVVLFSSRIIPGNEKLIGALQNMLVGLGCHLIVPGKLNDGACLHVSGHPARDELRTMYDWVRPQAAIPVHGEARHLKLHRELAIEAGVPEVVVPANGSMVRLAPGPVEIVDHVHAGKLGLDGTSFISMNSQLLKERRKMSALGTAVVTVVLDRYDDLAEPPLVSLFGIVNREETPERAERLDRDIERSLMHAFKDLSEPQRAVDKIVSDALRTALRQAVFARLGRKPLTDVHIVRAA